MKHDNEHKKNIIKSATAYLYDESKIRADELLHGMVVTVEKDAKKEKHKWLYICTDYGYNGWINRSHLSAASYEPSHYITTLTADILDKPKVQGKILISLSLGSRIQLISQEEGWSQVCLADGQIGYIRSNSLNCISNKCALKPFELSRRAITDSAKLYLGSQYRWGGKTPRGIDCSGLCFMAYYLNGVNIYRDAKIMQGYPVKKISPQKAGEGDLLFFPGHVGMLLEGGDMIHSSTEGEGVKVEPYSLEWQEKLLAVGSVF